MLRSAAAAGTEMRAGRYDTIGTGLNHLLQHGGPTRAAPRRHGCTHHLSGQGPGDIGGFSIGKMGNPIAIRTEPLNPQLGGGRRGAISRRTR
jgi:hypothetical protein